MIKPNPFTPQSGWEPKSFQGRKKQIQNFKKVIKTSISTNRPDHMVILGEWGVGKTSLLKLFKKISQNEGHMATFCSIPKFTAKDSILDAVNLIIEEILNGFPFIKGPEKLIEEIEGIGVSIAGFGGQVSRKKKQKSPQILLTDILLKLWKHLDTQVAVIIIDDAHNFGALPQVIDILRLVLSREEILSETNYLFVLSSTFRGWSDFIDKHDPIGRFFRKREKIEPLSKEETLTVITETLKNTGVSFSSEIHSLVYSSTKGQPYELQVLCSNLYESQIKGLVSKRQWKPVFKSTLADLGEDYFDSLFRKASNREEKILLALCKHKKDMTLQEIQKVIIEIDDTYPAKDVRLYVYRLVDKGLLLQKSRDAYGISDNMFREYLIQRLLQ